MNLLRSHMNLSSSFILSACASFESANVALCFSQVRLDQKYLVFPFISKWESQPPMANKSGKNNSSRRKKRLWNSLSDQPRQIEKLVQSRIGGGSLVGFSSSVQVVRTNEPIIRNIKMQANTVPSAYWQLSGKERSPHRTDNQKFHSHIKAVGSFAVSRLTNAISGAVLPKLRPLEDY